MKGLIKCIRFALLWPYNLGPKFFIVGISVDVLLHVVRYMTFTFPVSHLFLLFLVLR